MTSSSDLVAVLRAAQAQGVLPEGAGAPVVEHRPWPVVLLTALGAWLAVIPLLAVVAGLLGDLLMRGVGPYFVGILVLAGAVLLLRARDLPLFVEQLALPALQVGLGSLAFGLFRDMDFSLAALLLAMVCLGLSAVIHRPWITALLGASAAVLVMLSVQPTQHRFWRYSELAVVGALHLGLVLWVAAVAVQRTVLPRTAAWLESLQAGWVLPVLAGLAWWSGMTFLLGATLHGGDYTGRGAGDWRRHTETVWPTVLSVGSSVLAILAALWLARLWPSVRRPAAALAAVPWVVLAWWMPALGAVFMVLALTVATRRWLLAGAAGVAVAWIVGAFYYQLHWPLATKALVLLGAAAWLAAVAWWWRRGEAVATTAAGTAGEPPRGRASRVWMGVGLIVVMAAANVSIWQKQQLIAQGRPVFVALAPVDPRSLMQGDYMRLNFVMPNVLREAQPPSDVEGRLALRAQVDARGVATLGGLLSPQESLAPGEIRMELTPKNGSWVLVSDAWFFKEGEAERWAQARFGEFRVMPDGRALLVGMADAQLRPIQP